MITLVHMYVFLNKVLFRFICFEFYNNGIYISQLGLP